MYLWKRENGFTNQQRIPSNVESQFGKSSIRVNLGPLPAAAARKRAIIWTIVPLLISRWKKLTLWIGFPRSIKLCLSTDTDAALIQHSVPLFIGIAVAVVVVAGAGCKVPVWVRRSVCRVCNGIGAVRNRACECCKEGFLYGEHRQQK